MKLKSKDEIYVRYFVSADTEFETEIIFAVYNADGEKISEKTENIEVTKEQQEKETFLEIPDVEQGLLKIAVLDSDKEATMVEDFIVYDSSAITGFTVIDLLSSSYSYAGIIVVGFLITAFFMIRRILRLRKKHSR